IGGGRWSVRGAVHRIIPAVFVLGVAGGAIGYGVYLLLQDSALHNFSSSMAASLMACLPFALLWWVLAAVPLGRERYEAYAIVSMAAPTAVMVLGPVGAALDGSAGVAYGLAGGYVVGGSACAVWAMLLARRPESALGGDDGLGRAVSTGVRSWVN